MSLINKTGLSIQRSLFSTRCRYIGTSSRVNQTMRLQDGRTLGYAEYGSETGYPMMYMHGYPQCRLEASVIDHMFRQREIRVIAPERPGFGLSTFQPNRRITDWPSDVEALAKHLNLSRFAIIGGSGGGPFTLACALHLPHEMMSAVGILAGAGDWNAGAQHMPWIYRASGLAAKDWPAILQGSLSLAVWMVRNGLKTQKATQWLNDYLQKDENHGGKSLDERRTEYIRLLLEPFAQGAGPAAYEAKLLSQDWGIDFNKITFDNLFIWHAEKDWNSPLPMTEHYVRQLSNNPYFKVYEGDTHFTIHRHLDDVFSKLIPKSKRLD